MNIAQTRAKSWKLLSKKFNCQEGVVKFSKANSFKHELAKFVKCWNLWKEGKQFISEAVFENGQRADIFCLDNGEAYEIMQSETDEQFREKTKTYPCPVFPLRADDVLKEGAK